MGLAEKLVKFREQNGWSKQELADQLGVKETAVDKWESGKALPNSHKLRKLAKLMKISPDNLLREPVPEGSQPEEKPRYWFLRPPRR